MLSVVCCLLFVGCWLAFEFFFVCCPLFVVCGFLCVVRCLQRVVCFLWFVDSGSSSCVRLAIMSCLFFPLVVDCGDWRVGCCLLF